VTYPLHPYRRIRRGQRHAALVTRVLKMREMSGDERAAQWLAIGRMFDVPIGLIVGRRYLRLPNR